MAETRKYFEVMINGTPHTFLADPEDAKNWYGEDVKEVKSSQSVKNDADGTASMKAGQKRQAELDNDETPGSTIDNPIKVVGGKTEQAVQTSPTP